MIDLHDPWNCGWVMGMVVGNLVCYWFLYRPAVRLKDEYISRLEKRLEKK